MKRNDFVLFSESHSRFIVEVEPVKQKVFEKALKGIAISLLGKTEETGEFIVYGLDQKVCINAHITDLKEAWLKPLCW